MTPENPQDPQKGKVDKAKVEEEAKDSKETPVEAAAQPEPKAKPKARAKAKPAKPAAEPAEEPVVEADESASEPVEEPVAEADESASEPAEEPAAEPVEEPVAEADEAVAEPAEEAEAKPKAKAKAGPAKKEAPRRRRRRSQPEPGVQVRAQAKYVRTSARKARLVCDHIRGKDVVEARAILAFTPRAAAKAWIKLLESAVANAEHNHELVGEDLRIAAVHADEGPTLKRYRPRAMGRATRIRKRTSHLTITLTPKES
jgi:ribosomal protein L22